MIDINFKKFLLSADRNYSIIYLTNLIEGNFIGDRDYIWSDSSPIGEVKYTINGLIGLKNQLNSKLHKIFYV